jgi:pyruvate carboxylase
MAVVEAYKRGGERYVRQMLNVLETVATVPEQELSEEILKDRLKLYRDSNDAFRDLLLGKYGKLPLGFPPDWVYHSAFGADAGWALKNRTETSPLEFLEEMDINSEGEALKALIKRQPTDEELVLYLNHPGDAIKTIKFQKQFGDPNNIPIDVWFEGLELRKDLEFNDSNGKPHKMVILDISEPRRNGVSVVRYLLDSQILTYQVKVLEPETDETADHVMADPDNPYHLASPSRGDLWVMYVSTGDYVKEGEEMFNVSIMKQEKAVFAPFDAMVKRVLKTANYSEDRKMVSVREGELLVELAPAPALCKKCEEPIGSGDFKFCPFCGVTI